MLADAEGEFRDACRLPRSIWNTHRANYPKKIICARNGEGLGKALVLRAIPSVCALFWHLGRDAAGGDKMSVPRFTTDPLHDLNQMGGTIGVAVDGTVLYLHRFPSLPSPIVSSPH